MVTTSMNTPPVRSKISGGHFLPAKPLHISYMRSVEASMLNVNLSRPPLMQSPLRLAFLSSSSPQSSFRKAFLNLSPWAGLLNSI